ncbi:hypothetical protein ACIQU2_28440, partial [Pseudomonas sp. NPDC098740]|uniref:hypothetical protein n=1 Tax=Pseudomonas sp. NPDC098740 TaxID=3364486 RepID=UPI00383AFAD3
MVLFLFLGLRETIQGLWDFQSLYIEGFVLLSYIEKGNRLFSGVLQVFDRKAQLRVDGRFWKSIIRPTSGAVETENSLVNNELRSF